MEMPFEIRKHHGYITYLQVCEVQLHDVGRAERRLEIWEPLLGIREAVESLPRGERETVKEKIFHGNAKALYKF